MSWDEDYDKDWIHEVVVNHEEQYSIWPQFKGEPPLGWKTVGKSGLKQECLDHIKEVWTDMRPLSLRKWMAEMEERRPELEREHQTRLEEEARKPKDPRDNLVQWFSENEHPCLVSLRPERTLAYFRAALERGYIHIKFTDTRGGTELGFAVDRDRSDLAAAGLEKGTGHVHLEGVLTLKYSGPSSPKKKRVWIRQR